MLLGFVLGPLLENHMRRALTISLGDPTTFETKAGDEMVFAPGSIWIELLPSEEGDQVKGSFSVEKS